MSTNIKTTKDAPSLSKRNFLRALRRRSPWAFPACRCCQRRGCAKRRRGASPAARQGILGLSLGCVLRHRLAMARGRLPPWEGDPCPRRNCLG